jgi:Protein of unknown function DUF262
MSTSHTDIELEDVEQWFEQEEETPEVVQPAMPVDPGQKYADSQLRVVRETKDYQLDYLQHALQPGRELIDISPAYQRRLRWPTKKKSLLIESLLLNIPVPPIFLFERDYNEYEVIDGRQRLDAISSFLSNDYSLTGLEYWPELNRKRFLDLPSVLQRGLLRRSLPAVVLLAETKGTGDDGLDVRRVLFDRLNTGGIKLNPQELRNALYPGEFNSLLIRLARSPLFATAWGIPPYIEGEEAEPSDELLRNALFASLADAELVLRFFALRDAILHDKQGSLRTILDRFMASRSEVSEADLAEMEKQFMDCLGRLIKVFGDATFRLNGTKNKGTKRLSRPLYDAMMIALSRDPGIDIEPHGTEIRAALNNALGDPDKYAVLVGRGNTIGAVHERVELAASILRAGSE